MNQIGTFCSICERPLLAENFIWNRRTGEVGRDHVDASSWPDLLVLCHNCAECQAVTRDLVPGNLLLPDEAVTFSLDDGSPFRYTLEEVRRTFIGEEGEPIGDSEVVMVALVHGTTPEARNTIARFQLNTPYYDESGGTLRIPHAEYLSMIDRRLDMRTKVWRDAEVVVETLPKLTGWSSDPMYIVLLQRLIEVAGFWSVWATVLAAAVEDRDLLRIILVPAAATDAPASGLRGLTESASFLRGTSSRFLE